MKSRQWNRRKYKRRQKLGTKTHKTKTSCSILNRAFWVPLLSSLFRCLFIKTASYVLVPGFPGPRHSWLLVCVSPSFSRKMGEKTVIWVFQFCSFISVRWHTTGGVYTSIMPLYVLLFKHLCWKAFYILNILPWLVSQMFEFPEAAWSSQIIALHYENLDSTTTLIEFPLNGCGLLINKRS